VVDDLYWWQVNGVIAAGEAHSGYIAEAGPDGERLITPASLSQLVTIQRPFQGDFPVTQWWGENQAFYSQFTYDFVPLKGHNGIDFGTPVNTTLVAIDAGRVKKVDFEPDGFGHHILLEHSWGESLYAHLEQVHVQIDQPVQGGEVIGLSGNSGAASTGPHLHFGLRLDPYRRIDGWGGFADPQPFMNPTDLIISRSVQDTVAPMAPELPGRPRP
jgi:murein DD-endopeptidase MepM/ murein hydrolase activator NlpD